MAQLRELIVSQAVACKLLSEQQVAQCRASLPANASVEALVSALIKAQALTKWQVKQLLAGKSGGFFVSHYKLLEPLGAGAMGQVFRAADQEVARRQVAVKILPRQTATPAAVSRFRREGAAALQLQHDHIVRCFELGQHGDTHFLVMELVDGATLKDYIGRHGRLSVQETARIGYEVSLALEHAWQQQIVHRDIKPANILLTRDNRVRLADLGLAKFFGPQGNGQSLATQTGMLMGTLDYLAPEQAEDAKRADIRSDIYSLGCTLYHCLTGLPPFASGTEVQKIMAHRERVPAPIADRNKEVENLFADIIEKRMLAKRPEDRYQTPAELSAALEPWVGGASRGFNVLGLLEEVVQLDAASATPLATETQHGWDTHREYQRQGQTGPLATRPLTLRSRVERAGRAIGLSSVRDTLIAAAAVVLVALALLGWRYSQRGATVAEPFVSPTSPQQGSSSSEPAPPESDSATSASASVPMSQETAVSNPADGSPPHRIPASPVTTSTTPEPLAAPRHTTPEAQATVTPTTGFHWSQVAGAARYTIEFAFYNPSSGQRDLATSIATSGPALEDPSKRLQMNAPSRRGAWRVWAYDSSGKEGKKSEWSEFHIAAAADAATPPTPEVAMPALPKIRGLKSRYPAIQVTASSEWGGWPPTNLVDGNLESSWFSAQNESAAMKKGPWFEINLPQPVTVRRVAVWGCREPAYYNTRLAVLEGRVLLLDAQHKQLGRTTAKVQGRDLEFIFEPAVSAVRYVRFVSLWDEGNRNEFGDIALGEVQIE